MHTYIHTWTKQTASVRPLDAIIRYKCQFVKFHILMCISYACAVCFILLNCCYTRFIQTTEKLLYNVHNIVPDIDVVVANDDVRMSLYISWILTFSWILTRKTFCTQLLSEGFKCLHQTTNAFTWKYFSSNHLFNTNFKMIALTSEVHPSTIHRYSHHFQTQVHLSTLDYPTSCFQCIAQSVSFNWTLSRSSRTHFRAGYKLLYPWWIVKEEGFLARVAIIHLTLFAGSWG